MSFDALQEAVVRLLNTLSDAISFFTAISTVASISLTALIVYWVKNPEKFEKLVALIHKYLKHFWKTSEYAYIKYDIQGKINDYIAQVRKKVDHITASKAVIQWIDTDIDEKTFINNGKLVLRMRKSDNQNQNIVNACVAFVGHSFLRSAKTYLAKYQREAVDMYVCYDLLRMEQEELLVQFAEDFLHKKLTNEKLSLFFEAFVDIDKANLFYPVFVQEITYLGEKIFTHRKNYQAIHAEVRGLVRFLTDFANRRVGDESIRSEYIGNYCCFAIKIIGKSLVIQTSGERVYLNHLDTLSPSIDTLYLIGKIDNKEFMDGIVERFTGKGKYRKVRTREYSAVVKSSDGNDMTVKSYMVLLRKKHIEMLKRVPPQRVLSPIRSKAPSTSTP